MAETRYMDCPSSSCGRTNVIGYKKEEKESKWLKGGAAGYGVVVGGLLGGPVGAAVGLAAGKYAGDKLAEANENGRACFKFKCPSCGHEWSSWFDV